MGQVQARVERSLIRSQMQRSPENRVFPFQSVGREATLERG